MIQINLKVAVTKQRNAVAAPRKNEEMQKEREIKREITRERETLNMKHMRDQTLQRRKEHQRNR